MGSRDKSEFWRARRTVGKARELLKGGNIAEAEALCLEQMEHVHARLNMDSKYRKEYPQAMAKQNAERTLVRVGLSKYNSYHSMSTAFRPLFIALHGIL